MLLEETDLTGWIAFRAGCRYGSEADFAALAAASGEEAAASVQYGNMREMPAGAYVLCMGDPSFALLFAVRPPLNND
eukprot:4374965-Pyramimonas_sp.AAC.2